MDIRSGNPVWKQAFSGSSEWAGPAGAGTGAVQERDQAAVMTYAGTVNRALLLVGFLVLGAGWTWFLFATRGPGAVLPWMIGGLVLGLIAVFALYFKPIWSPVLAPVYAVCEGLAIGGISAVFNSLYQGIVIQAAGLTVGTLFVMLTLYQLGIVRATAKFKMGMLAAMGAIMLFYLVTFILGFIPATQAAATGLISGHGGLSIAISVVIVIVAAFCLILDFDMIDQGVQQGAPKYMEWYAGFGLLVTLVWLYLEILSLLAKMQDRR